MRYNPFAAGADELVFYDITASFEGRALFTDILTLCLCLFQRSVCGQQALTERVTTEKSRCRKWHRLRVGC